MKHFLIGILVMIITGSTVTVASGQKGSSVDTLPTFKLHPLNEIPQDLFEKIPFTGDDYNEQIKKAFTPISEGKKEIILVPCEDCSLRQAKQAVTDRGLLLAPSNYLLRLGADYPEVHKYFGRIVALDKEFIIDDERFFITLGMVQVKTSKEEGPEFTFDDPRALILSPQRFSKTAWIIAMKPPK